MTLAEHTLDTARTYLGHTETAKNDAPWLQELMRLAGNPCSWQAPEPYCISAAMACWALTYKAAGLPFPVALKTPSTQTAYQMAVNNGMQSDTPQPGAIAIFRLGSQWHGHAELVVAAGVEGIDTIGFNTGGTSAGSQREGEGVFQKRRNYAQFQKSETGLWLRGYIIMPHANDVLPQTPAAQ